MNRAWVVVVLVAGCGKASGEAPMDQGLCELTRQSAIIVEGSLSSDGTQLAAATYLKGSGPSSLTVSLLGDTFHGADTVFFGFAGSPARSSYGQGYFWAVDGGVYVNDRVYSLSGLSKPRLRELIARYDTDGGEACPGLGATEQRCEADTAADCPDAG
jgi:hypothetical protein